MNEHWTELHSLVSVLRDIRDQFQEDFHDTSPQVIEALLDSINDVFELPGVVPVLTYLESLDDEDEDVDEEEE